MAAAPESSANESAVGAARRRASPWLIAAVGAYVVSRLVLYFLLSAQFSDVSVYFRYALQGVDHDLPPYGEQFSIEYPPVAYWAVCLPRQLSSDRFASQYVSKPEFLRQEAAYGRVFRGLMLACDAASFALFLAIVRRRRPERTAWAAWGFVTATALLGYVLLERLDVGVTLSIVAWAYCAIRSDDDERGAWYWSTLGYAALGVGIAYKLIPLLIVPFPLWADALRLWRRPRDWRVVYGPTVLLLTAIGPFAYYHGSIGNDLGRLFNYHAIRGVEIESTAATLMMLGESRDALRPYFDFGAWNLGGAWEQPLLAITGYALVGALLLVGLRASAAPRLDGGFGGVAAYRFALATVPVALVFAKVFSVQYLLWGLPLLILAAVECRTERLFRGMTAACVLAAALTTAYYPFHFLDEIIVRPYTDERPPPWTLVETRRPVAPRVYEKLERAQLGIGPPVPVLIARNVLFAACTLVAVGGVLKRR